MNEEATLTMSNAFFFAKMGKTNVAVTQRIMDNQLKSAFGLGILPTFMIMPSLMIYKIHQ